MPSVKHNTDLENIAERAKNGFTGILDTENSIIFFEIDLQVIHTRNHLNEMLSPVQAY